MIREEWTIGLGFRRALLHLVIWSLICLIVWAAIIWLLTPWMNTWPIGRGSGRFTPKILYCLVGAPTGWVMAKVLFTRMLDVAGFASAILSWIAFIFICGASLSGVMLAGVFRPLHDGRDWIIMVSAALVAAIDVAYETFADR